MDTEKYYNTLIMMLKNESTGLFHPIFYLEHSFPGETASQTIRRFKSKGHLTVGLDRETAVSKANELADNLKGHGHSVKIDIDSPLYWDGVEMPIDNQLVSAN